MPQEAPNPPIAPPLFFVLFFMAGSLLDLIVPFRFLPAGFHRIPAVLLTLGGMGIFFMAWTAMRRARTPLSPYQPAKTLLTTGPFLRTRNPVYLALAWIYLGFSCWINSWWPLFLFPVLVHLFNRFVIAREEAHLEARFGKAWRDYAARTRRWV
jgi:protein-S-isoprenylcysteine O-methyltransferase Ste14